MVLTGKNCVLLSSLQEWLLCCLTAPAFHMFTQSIKFYKFHYYVLRVQMFEKCDSSNRHGFCLSTERKLYLRSFILKQTTQILLKSGTRDLQNSPPFERLACFYVTISENFERFQQCNFKTDFLENENLFQKTGVLFFS